MNALLSQGVLRPARPGFRTALRRRLLASTPFLFRILRRAWPIPGFGTFYAVTLHDDVREVFATDAVFGVPYAENLAVLTGSEPFFLGMANTPQYHRQIAAMRRVIRLDDLDGLAHGVVARTEAILAQAPGRVEVVDQMVRRVTFDILCPYFGVPAPTQGRLDVWATRLFEFQFVSTPGDESLRREAEAIAPAFRDHIDAEIARRKQGGAAPADDVMARCLALQAAGESGYSDVEIRTALLCMVVGGPPQPPMVVPQALEQLLRRPEALALAIDAARRDEDDLLRRIVREAMRFDPLAPGLPRIALQDWVVARGTARQKRIPKGATVLVAFASAMMDDRRVPEPDRFDPYRMDHEYIHFGHAMHECFGRYINGATLHMMLKPLLRRGRVRRAAGAEGHLTKNGPFAERLVVEFH
jgi:cytochrome P450